MRATGDMRFLFQITMSYTVYMARPEALRKYGVSWDSEHPQRFHVTYYYLMYIYNKPDLRAHCVYEFCFNFSITVELMQPRVFICLMQFH